MLADEESSNDQGQHHYRSQTLSDFTITSDRSYISGIASMYPASDWFTGFDSFNAFDTISGRWYGSFRIETYPCDAGTETGNAFHMGNAAEHRKQPISAITTSTILQRPNE